jgi:sugar phosphate isomerase/epimerase
MFEVAGALGAKVAVFGSPKNRIKGNISKDVANDTAMEFFSSLVPSLEKNDVVLTLEPNAPDYGADYLLDYEDVCKLSSLIGSNQIAPQIDTGCLWMVGADPISALEITMPHHLHLSTPNLGEVPGLWDFSDLLQKVSLRNYEGWIVIESLEKSLEKSLRSSRWLKSEVSGLK